MSRSTNRRASVAEPEVWFRIVHITIDSQNTCYQKQTVEIGLGPSRAFENSNIGTLTRRVRSDRVDERDPKIERCLGFLRIRHPQVSMEREG